MRKDCRFARIADSENPGLRNRRGVRPGTTFGAPAIRAIPNQTIFCRFDRTLDRGQAGRRSHHDSAAESLRDSQTVLGSGMPRLCGEAFYTERWRGQKTHRAREPKSSKGNRRARRTIQPCSTTHADCCAERLSRWWASPHGELFLLRTRGVRLCQSASWRQKPLGSQAPGTTLTEYHRPRPCQNLRVPCY